MIGMVDNNEMVKRRTPEEINAYIDGYVSAINRFIKNLEDSNPEDAIRRMRIISDGIETARVKKEGEAE